MRSRDFMPQLSFSLTACLNIHRMPHVDALRKGVVFLSLARSSSGPGSLPSWSSVFLKIALYRAALHTPTKLLTPCRRRNSLRPPLSFTIWWVPLEVTRCSFLYGRPDEVGNAHYRNPRWRAFHWVLCHSTCRSNMRVFEKQNFRFPLTGLRQTAEYPPEE